MKRPGLFFLSACLAARLACPGLLRASQPQRQLLQLEDVSPEGSAPEQAKSKMDFAWESGAGEAPAASVFVGASSKTITPATGGKPWEGLYFAGYTRLESPKNWYKWLFRGLRRDPVFYNHPKGVHDDLYARALVIKAGKTKVAVVTLDAVGFLYPDTRVIRDRVADLGYDLVIVQATHNHSGPDTIGLWGPMRTHAAPIAAIEYLFGFSPIHSKSGRNPRFMELIYSQAASAIREADQKAQASDLIFAQAGVPDFNGKSIIEDRRSPEVFDRRLHVLRAQSPSGESIATMVNLGVHPELFWSKITQISADISGQIASSIEQKGGGIGLHANGAIGALIAPGDLYGYDDKNNKMPLSEELALRWKGIQKIGELVSAGAIASTLNQKPAPVAAMDVRVRKIFIPLDNLLLDRLSKKGVFERERYTKGMPDPDGQDIQTEIDLIVLKDARGDPLAEIFTIPGELAPEIYLGGFLPADASPNPGAPETPVLKNHLRAPHQFLLGLGNDELGYIIPLNDFLFPNNRKLPILPQKDRFGRRHYEETVSAGSQMSQIIAWNLIGMLEDYYQGGSEFTQEEVAVRSRRAMLATFASRKEALPALVNLFLHEPADDVTPLARQAVADIGGPDAAAYLGRAYRKSKDGNLKKEICRLILEIRKGYEKPSWQD